MPHCFLDSGVELEKRQRSRSFEHDQTRYLRTSAIFRGVLGMLRNTRRKRFVSYIMSIRFLRKKKTVFVVLICDAFCTVVSPPRFRQERVSGLLVAGDGVEPDGGVRRGGRHVLRRGRTCSSRRLVPRGHRFTDVRLRRTSCTENDIQRVSGYIYIYFEVSISPRKSK